MAKPLGGVYPPIATAFKADGSLAPALPDFLAWLAAARVDGVVALGSTGEAPSLTETERVQWLSSVRSALPGSLRLIAGTGAESTRATLERTRAAADSGAEAALVFTPFYFRKNLTPDMVAAHYEAVASASPIPVLIYNVPAHTGWDFHPRDWAARLGGHPNIAGLKDSSGDLARISYLRSVVAADFMVLTGAGERMVDALEAGADGAIAALANVFPAECAAILGASHGGDASRAGALQSRIAPLGEAFTARYGVRGLKAVLEMLGFDHGPPRAPVSTLDASEYAQLRHLLEEAQRHPDAVAS
jgi:4-hydroxy-2-oxoglutarate aldolase